jgi:hypothetical protein
MQPFEFGGSLTQDDLDDRVFDDAFDFGTPVTVNPYRRDTQMPVPSQPWGGFSIPPSSGSSAMDSTAGASGSQGQSFVDIRLENSSRHGKMLPRLPQ